MNGYEKLQRQMRKQGQHDAETGVRRGKMGQDLSCQVGALVLEKEDLLFAQQLLTGYTDQDGAAVPPLAAGDTVLVKRLSDTDYAVLCKLVRSD